MKNTLAEIASLSLVPVLVALALFVDPRWLNIVWLLYGIGVLGNAVLMVLLIIRPGKELGSIGPKPGSWQRVCSTMIDILLGLLFAFLGPMSLAACILAYAFLREVVGRMMHVDKAASRSGRR